MSLLHRRVVRICAILGDVQFSEDAVELLERHMMGVVVDAAERARSGGKKRITPAMMRRAINGYK